MMWIPLFLADIDLFSPYMLIIEASVIIVLSYIYAIISERTNIPSVLLLILSGVLIQLGLNYAGIALINLMPTLEILGIVGLIMIVLEAALDLELSREKLPLIGKSFLIGFLGLLFSAFAMAVIIQWMLKMDFLRSLLYATPLAIMSSAIIIPSTSRLSGEKKEFMVYESTFSDILGIMVFYFIISFMEAGGTQATIQFAGSFVVTVLVAVIASYGLVFFFKDLKGHSKLFLLIGILLILYAMGKLLHLSPLLIILVFGLALSNHQTFFRIFKNDWAEEDPIEKIKKEFHLITLETAFVVRTFFFVVFGMTISLASLVDGYVFLVSFLLLAALYLIRFVVLRLFLGKNIFPELFLAPRGLITILLFYAIPVAFKVEKFDAGILLYVILISSLVMTYSLIREAR